MKDLGNKFEKVISEYEQKHPMNDKERHALYLWIKAGNSVNENPSMASDEHGELLDFLTVFRYEEEIRENLMNLTGKEKEMYLTRLRGFDTLDTLKDDLNKAFNRIRIYETVLNKYGLLEEADILFNESKENLLEPLDLSLKESPF